MATQVKVLIVDDDPQVRTYLKKRLELTGYFCTMAENGQLGLEKIKENDYDLVMTDVKMPVMDGLTMIREMRRLHTDLPVVIILSAYTELEQLRTAIQQGAHDYLTKPFNINELDLTIDRALEKNRLIRENIEYKKRLEEKIEQQTLAIWNQLQELEKSNAELMNAYESTILALSAALEAKDKTTEDHVRRVEFYVTQIAKKMNFSEDTIRTLRWGAILHDIGKIGITDPILTKTDKLTREEREVMKSHPMIGYEMLSGIPFLKDVLPIILCHHEHYDGSGYPKGIKGEDIPLLARIFSMADSYDTMISGRPYNKAVSPNEAINELRRCSGKQFDPKLVKIFIDIMTSGSINLEKNRSFD